MKAAYFFFFFLCLFNPKANAQLEGGNAYLISEFLEVAIHGEKGKEGCSIGAGFHYRGSGGIDSCGIVADPFDTGWGLGLSQGDFFSPGTKENGFGIEIDGVNYSNNYGDYDIVNTVPISYETDLGCSVVKWEGEVSGVTLKVYYRIKEGDLYYTTTVTMINGTGADLTDLYYYRNVDPDNNQHATGLFSTDNTIESQPDDACEKALVSARQLLPNPSYFAFGAMGSKFRVCYGGFSNRSASDLWNALDPWYEGEEGATEEDSDIAMSLAYKTDLNAGDSVSFSYAVIFNESALDEAFEQFYNINYRTESGLMGSFWNRCTDPVMDTIAICQGSSITLFVEGAFAFDYDWIWTPDIDLSSDEGDSTIATPTDIIAYTVSADISECFTLVSQSIVINPIASEAIMLSDDVTIFLDEATTLEAAGGDTYTWFPTDDLSDPTAAITDATPTETTTYSVIVYSDTSDCMDTLSVTVTVIDDSGIGENNQYFYSIYPNPFSDYFTINFGEELIENHTIIIQNILGQEIYRIENITGSSLEIKDVKLVIGVYILYLFDSDSEELFSTKLLVE